MPRDLSENDLVITAAPTRAPVIDATASVDSFCGERPEVCAVGTEAASLAREAGLYAAERAVAVLSSEQPSS
jgi:hypothetical protein